MAFPYTETNAFRIYDYMVSRWVGSLPVDYGNISGQLQDSRGLLWVYASPTKALAAMRDLLLRKGWVRPGDVGADNMEYEDWITVPLPFASIQRLDPEWDAERANVPFKFRKFKRVGDNFYSARFPLPYDINYTIEYWMRRKFTDAHIREWLMTQVSPVGAANNEFFLTASLGELWGDKMIPVQNISYTDNSDLDPGDDADRTLRFTLNFTLKAWIFPPVGDPAHPDVGDAPVPIVLRVITDVGTMDRRNPDEFSSAVDRIIGDPEDNVEEVLETNSVLFETSSGVTVDENTFDIPAGGYIQTVDVPIFDNELAFIEADLELDSALTDGIDIEVLDYDNNPLQHFKMVRNVTEDLASFLAIPETGDESFRVRFTPTDATELTVNDLKIRTVTPELEIAENLLPSGDMESGSATDWEPQVGSTTLVPSSLAFSTAEFFEGAQSLKCDTVSQNQGIERVFSVAKRKLFLVELRLFGSGGRVELGVLDDEDGSHAIESLFSVQPQSTWERYAMIVRSTANGKISFRVRQEGTTGTTIYVDAVRLYQIVVRDEPGMGGLYS